MRSYDHRPDRTFLEGLLPELAHRIELSEQAIPKKVAEGKLRIYGPAVDTAFTLAQVPWGLGRPLDEAAATMRRATTRIRDALGHGFDPGDRSIDRWLEIALIGADPSAAAAVADRIDQGVDGLDAVVSLFLGGVVSLMRDQATPAAEAADALGRSLDAPATPPRSVTAFAALDALLRAAATGDQPGFDQAAVARRQARATTYGGSVELRRSANGLLDAAGTAVARLAFTRGMALPGGDPYLGTELLQALPWPGSGV